MRVFEISQCSNIVTNICVSDFGDDQTPASLIASCHSPSASLYDVNLGGAMQSHLLVFAQICRVPYPCSGKYRGLASINVANPNKYSLLFVLIKVKKEN